MKAGVIGTVDGNFDALESFETTVKQGDFELKRCIDVRRGFTLPSGIEAYYGHAAMEQVKDREQVMIQNGEISIYEEPQKVPSYTEFLTVPGEVVVVDSGAGSFAYSMIGSQTNTNIERAEINLSGFAADHEDDSDPWKVGFYGHLGNAENGVVHGTDLLSDDELSGVLHESNLNQLGVEYPYDGQMLKANMAESGYFEIYQPSNYESKDYLQFILDEVIHYLK
ncbi:hypothetical protein [Halococcoides cellulosivorans]|nr:hypothetical protein [Halococcoides cellulosivorans]